ncbi:MAG: hypothetical protein QG672_876 [Pseudomonadota bacterium]|nr:hypothetical protein [Pseudomonadota bacterium]
MRLSASDQKAKIRTFDCWQGKKERSKRRRADARSQTLRRPLGPGVSNGKLRKCSRDCYERNGYPADSGEVSPVGAFGACGRWCRRLSLGRGVGRLVRRKNRSNGAGNRQSTATAEVADAAVAMVDVAAVSRHVVAGVKGHRCLMVTFFLALHLQGGRGCSHFNGNHCRQCHLERQQQHHQYGEKSLHAAIIDLLFMAATIRYSRI